MPRPGWSAAWRHARAALVAGHLAAITLAATPGRRLVRLAADGLGRGRPLSLVGAPGVPRAPRRPRRALPLPPRAHAHARRGARRRRAARAVGAGDRGGARRGAGAARATMIG